MNRPVIARAALGALLVAGVLVVAATVSVQSATPAASTSKLLTASDQDELGFHISQVPATARSASISTASAVTNAARWVTNINGAAPDEVLHVMAAPDASSPERSVFVFIWKGGDAVPGGPEGNGLHSVSYQGVVVDDQTGEVLRSFATGSQ